jgi:hypothetical protein
VFAKVDVVGIKPGKQGGLALLSSPRQLSDQQPRFKKINRFWNTALERVSKEKHI